MFLFDTNFPHYRHAPGIPVAGDSLTVLATAKHKLTLKDLGLLDDRFAIDLPTGGPATSVTHVRRAPLRPLIESLHSETQSWIDHLSATPPYERDGIDFAIRLKRMLETYRSVLDYVAHDIAEVCNLPLSPEKVQFPIIKKDQLTPEQVEATVRSGFPGLETKNSKLFRYLVEIQTDKSHKSWLADLGNLTNSAKHRSLPHLTPQQFNSIYLGFNELKIRFGELGFARLTVEEGTSILFDSATGQLGEVAGPFEITSETIPQTLSVPSGFYVFQKQWTHWAVSGTPRSLVGLLWVIDKGILSAVSRISRMLCPP